MHGNDWGGQRGDGRGEGGERTLDLRLLFLGGLDVALGGDLDLVHILGKSVCATGGTNQGE